MKKFLRDNKAKIKVRVVMAVFTLLALSCIYFSDNYKKYEGTVQSNNIVVLPYKSNSKAAEESELYLSDIEPIAKSVGDRKSVV